MKKQNQKPAKPAIVPQPTRAGFLARAVACGGLPPEVPTIGASLTYPSVNREKLLAAGCRADAVDGLIDEIARSAANEAPMQQNVWIILDAVDRIAAKLEISDSQENETDQPKGTNA
jgi:hypothetical protein